MMHIIAGNVMRGWSDIVEERPANFVRQDHWQMKMLSKWTKISRAVYFRIWFKNLALVTDSMSYKPYKVQTLMIREVSEKLTE